MTYSWPLITPPVGVPSVAPASSYLSPAPGVSLGLPYYYTAENFLELVSNLLPEWYLLPLQSPGPGYELLQAFAAIFERASLALGRTECSMFNLYASGGVQGRGTVQFYRATDGAGAFVVKRGTVVRASKSNREFVLTADVSFGSTDLIVNGVVEGATPAGEYNVPGPLITADGTLLEGEIDEVTFPYLDPVYAEPTIQVRQTGPVTLGQTAALDSIGADRRIDRNAGESDDVYRERIRKLPDTVSPAAIKRQLDSIFLPIGLSYDLIETWENRYDSCWNAPLGDLSNPIQGTLLEGTLAYNDTRTDGFYGRWMGQNDHRAAFVVVVPLLQVWSERAMAYNDPGAVTEDFVSALGVRATSAYNSPALDTDLIFSGVYNGTDASIELFYRNLVSLLTHIKGGGVSVAIELDPAYAG